MKNLIIGAGLKSGILSLNLTKDMVRIVRDEADLYRYLYEATNDLKIFYDSNTDYITSPIQPNMLNLIIDDSVRAVDFLIDQANVISQEIREVDIQRENLDPETGRRDTLVRAEQPQGVDTAFLDVTAPLTTLEQNLENVEGRGIRRDISIMNITGQMINTIRRERQLLVKMTTAITNLINFYNQHKDILRVPPELFNGGGMTDLVSLQNYFEQLANIVKQEITGIIKIQSEFGIQPQLQAEEQSEEEKMLSIR